jgi:hypothetical protein
MTKSDLQASVAFILRDNWFKRNYRIGFGKDTELSMEAEIDLAKEEMD